jgi:hypothetical protein
MLRSEGSLASRVGAIRTHGVNVVVVTAPRSRCVKQACHMEKVVVQPSPIHGLGILQRDALNVDEIIIDGCREVLTEEAVKAPPTQEKSSLPSWSKHLDDVASEVRQSLLQSERARH